MYRIRITETLSKTVPVEAENISDALQKVSDMYRDSKIILTAEDFCSLDFSEAEKEIV